MIERIITIVIYLVCFLVSLYALSGINFASIMRKGKTQEIQALYLILALVIAYLLGNFIIVIVDF